MTKISIPLPSMDPAPTFTVLDLAVLRDEGVLMAANEAFFWPRGLTLTWDWREDGQLDALRIAEWVYPDGHLEPITLAPKEERGPQRRIRYTEWAKARKARMRP